MSSQSMSPSDALTRLKEGNARYLKDSPKAVSENRRAQDRRDETSSGQAPWAIVLSCADSRVAPELIFDTGIGELFVIRVAGNIANTSSIASIEYAVANLGTSLILVLGHGSCGAVSAAMQDVEAGYNLNHLLGHLKPAVKFVDGDAQSAEDVERCVRKNAELQADELTGRSQIISQAVSAGSVKIISGYYHLTGQVDLPASV